jgi:hypothetical protein
MPAWLAQQGKAKKTKKTKKERAGLGLDWQGDLPTENWRPGKDSTRKKEGKGAGLLAGGKGWLPLRRRWGKGGVGR